MAECTIMFYRSEAWSKLFSKAGIDKPAGMARSKHHYRTKAEAEETAKHVNAAKPEFPCSVLEFK